MWCLPSRKASRLLATAIARNAWTLAGMGRFSAQHSRPTTFSISGCPICRGATSTMPYCDFYTGIFERLFIRLIHGHARVGGRGRLSSHGRIRVCVLNRIVAGESQKFSRPRHTSSPSDHVWTTTSRASK